MNLRQVSLLLSLVLLVGCNPKQIVKEGKLDDDIYYLDLPFWPPADMKVYVPMANDYEHLEARTYADSDYVYVTFGTELPGENSVKIEVIPTRMKFKTFEKLSQKLVFEDYDDNPHANVTHIYQEETYLNKHPAYYNVYVVEYDNDTNRTIVIQYLINYLYYQANVTFMAQTNAENDPIFSPRVAIEKTYMPAYEFFRSLRVSVEETKEEEDDDDDDEDEHEDESPSRAKI